MLLMTAILTLGDGAYGAAIQEKAEEIVEGGKSVSLGSIYTTLDRLERKGFVRSSFGEPTRERGGKAKRYFELTASGERALKETARVSRSIVTPLEELWGTF